MTSNGVRLKEFIFSRQLKLPWLHAGRLYNAHRVTQGTKDEKLVQLRAAVIGNTQFGL